MKKNGTLKRIIEITLRLTHKKDNGILERNSFFSY